MCAQYGRTCSCRQTKARSTGRLWQQSDGSAPARVTRPPRLASKERVNVRCVGSILAAAFKPVHQARPHTEAPPHW